jgi:hypothetical protein
MLSTKFSNRSCCTVVSRNVQCRVRVFDGVTSR